MVWKIHGEQREARLGEGAGELEDVDFVLTAAMLEEHEGVGRFTRRWKHDDETRARDALLVGDTVCDTAPSAIFVAEIRELDDALCSSPRKKSCDLRRWSSVAI